jgi:hypothetical protein
MKRKLLFAYATILVITMIIVPVLAASPATAANPLDQILTFVKDYKTKLDTILTKLTALQTDVTTIITTTNTINTKLNDRLEPIRYEYYTGKMSGFSPPPTQYWAIIDVTNTGDSPANVCEIEWGQHSQLATWKVFKNHCYTVNPQWSQTDTSTIVTNSTYSVFVKSTSDSKYVAPQVRYFDEDVSTNVPTIEYLPEDFLKVEVYS